MLVMLRTPRSDVSVIIYSKKKLLNRHSEMLVMLNTPRNDVSAENNYTLRTDLWDACDFETTRLV